MFEIIERISPNWSSRRGYRPEAIVIHIMDGTLMGTAAWFARRSSGVSAHYGVGRNGEIHRYVDENLAAFHAGLVNRPTWRLLKRGVNPNLYTIGIEHEGFASQPWTDEMYAASGWLIADIARRWQIPIDADHIIPHNAIRRTKTCPGAGCDIKRLIAQARAYKERQT